MEPEPVIARLVVLVPVKPAAVMPSMRVSSRFSAVTVAGSCVRKNVSKSVRNVGLVRSSDGSAGMVIG